jgi:hypothetical protein
VIRVATSANCVSGSESGRLIQPLLSTVRQLQSREMSAERVASSRSNRGVA